MNETRIVAQIASGIGFLGAGVIIRDGLNVKGLDTAATIWCSAAVGATAGSGLHLGSAIASLAILTTNIFLRARSFNGDQADSPEHAAASQARYELSVICDTRDFVVIRDHVIALARRSPLVLQGLSSAAAPPEHCRELKVSLSADARNDRHVGSVVARLAVTPAVIGASWRYVPQPKDCSSASPLRHIPARSARSSTAPR